MVQQTDRQTGVLRSLDWWTIGIYVALLACGWLSVCGASYTYGDTDIFSLSTRSGMQIVWIGTSICLGFVLLMLDDRFYDTFSYIIYAFLLLLLFATIFNPHEIKGSRSWLVLGPLRLQPAEFAKFATALAVAKIMSSYGFNLHRWKDFAIACTIVLLPMLFIIAQKETGSALVYISFFLMFYREGMTGSILVTGVAMIIYFVVGIRYENIFLLDTSTSIGKFAVLLLVQAFSSAFIYVYCKNKPQALYVLGYSVMAIGLGKMLGFKYPANFNYPYVAESITDFWRRWHITLSTWFRDYVYIPLGGNRCSKSKNIRNILIVWLLTGIWHGASWNFIIWGLYFGVILIIEKVFLLKKLEKAPKALRHIYALFLIMIGWLIFSIEDLETMNIYFKKMFMNGKIIDNEFIFYLKNYFVYILFGIIFSMPILRKIKMSEAIKVVGTILYIILFIITLAFIISDSYNPFLYFRF